MNVEEALGLTALAANDNVCKEHMTHSQRMMSHAPQQQGELHRPEGGEAGGHSVMVAVRPGDITDAATRDAVFTVAAYCYDLNRKLEYIFRALSEFAGTPKETTAPADLAAEIQCHHDFIHKGHATPEEHFRRAYAVLHQVYERVQAAGYDAMLETKASGASFDADAEVRELTREAANVKTKSR